MELPTKIALGSIILALALFAAEWTLKYSAQRELEAAIKVCNAEAIKETSKQASKKPIARLLMPDGQVVRIEVPQGTTPEQAVALAEQQIASKQLILVCDPLVLKDLAPRNALITEADRRGLLSSSEKANLLAQVPTSQLLVLSAMGKVDDVPSWPTTAAILALFVGLMPFAWYFLLRRIRELRDAITGK